MTFTVGISPDFLDSAGSNVWGDIGLAGLDAAGLEWEYIQERAQACTAAGTVATITPDGARGPVATATLSMLLSVLHHTVTKDRLVRDQRWDLRENFMGTGLTGKTIGLLGVGNTGGE